MKYKKELKSSFKTSSFVFLGVIIGRTIIDFTRDYQITTAMILSRLIAYLIVFPLLCILNFTYVVITSDERHTH